MELTKPKTISGMKAEAASQAINKRSAVGWWRQLSWNETEPKGMNAVNGQRNGQAQAINERNAVNGINWWSELPASGSTSISFILSLCSFINSIDL